MSDAGQQAWFDGLPEEARKVAERAEKAEAALAIREEQVREAFELVRGVKGLDTTRLTRLRELLTGAMTETQPSSNPPQQKAHVVECGPLGPRILAADPLQQDREDGHDFCERCNGSFGEIGCEHCNPAAYVGLYKRERDVERSRLVELLREVEEHRAGEDPDEAGACDRRLYQLARTILSEVPLVVTQQLSAQPEACSRHPDAGINVLGDQASEHVRFLRETAHQLHPQKPQPKGKRQ